MKPKLKPPGNKRLKLKYGEPLSKFAFKLNLCRYNVDARVMSMIVDSLAGAYTRSHFSST